MSYAQQSMAPVIHADADTRATFLVKVYQHLGLALGAFLVFEYLLFSFGFAKKMGVFISGSPGSWLLIMGGFMIVQAIASRSAHKVGNSGIQYAALFGLAVAEALIFAPILWFAFQGSGTNTVVNAAIVTVVGFAGLSVVAFLTRKDLSFLRPILMWASFAAIGLIVVAYLFKLELGILFSVAMVALAGATILYQTQNIVRRYPEWAYVGAAVSLFASFMMLFWYVLRIFMGRR